MNVYYSVNYLKVAENKPNENWWRAFHLTRAVKNGVLGPNAKCDIPMRNGSVFKLDNSTAPRTRKFLGQFISLVVGEQGLDGAALVPIPSKDAVIGCAGPTRATSMLADAVHDHQELEVCDALRYTEQLQKASEGGYRDARILYEKMQVVLEPPAQPVVLIDDLITSSGHMKAARRRLVDAGFDVRFGVVFAQTVQDTTAFEPLARGERFVDDNWGLEEPPGEFLDIQDL